MLVNGKPVCDYCYDREPEPQYAITGPSVRVAGKDRPVNWKVCSVECIRSLANSFLIKAKKAENNARVVR